MRAFVTVLALAALVLPASAQFDIYDYMPVGRGYDPTWPPDGPGTQWHQMQPAANFCTWAEQTDHDDHDGDGQISVCDNIQLDGVWKHIEWVGPTIGIEPVGGGDLMYVEPVDGRQNEYHIIHPPELACVITTITGGMVTECEVVTVDSGPFAGEWHIVEISTNIHTNGGSPVEPSTWSKIKDFFRDLF